jgi:hypothetical protein
VRSIARLPILSALTMAVRKGFGIAMRLAWLSVAFRESKTIDR